MNWRWRLLRWWIRWNLQRDGASPETIRAALLYVGIAWEMQRLVRAGFDHAAAQPKHDASCITQTEPTYCCDCSLNSDAAQPEEDR